MTLTIRLCNRCELTPDPSGTFAYRFTVIGDGEHCCRVCGGVEFSILRQKRVGCWFARKWRTWR